MSEHDPDATPAQQEAVRRLLAEARHDHAVPPQVAARLDGVLAQLVAEGDRAIDPPPPSAHQAVVVDLAARRRRRVTALLGAAAAVVVLGVGASQIIGTVQDDSGDSSSAADDRSADPSRAPAAAQENDQNPPLVDGTPPIDPNGEASSEPPPTSPGTTPSVRPPGVPTITRRSFGTSVVTLRSAAVVTSLEQVQLSGKDLTSAPMFVCEPTFLGEGRLLAVRYTGIPAVLAYRPPTGDNQVVDLVRCGTGDVVRSKVIAFP